MNKLSKGLRLWHTLAIRRVNIGKQIKQREKIVVGIRLGLLWASAAMGIVGLVFGFDLIGQALEECLTVFFEFIQENLESMFRKGFKLDLYHAQMATAYTGFVVFVGVAYFLCKKFTLVFREMQSSWSREREKTKELLSKHWQNIMVWWDTLDSFNKFFAAVVGVVLAIPVVSIVCIVLGKVLAEFV